MEDRKGQRDRKLMGMEGGAGEDVRGAGGTFDKIYWPLEK